MYKHRNFTINTLKHTHLHTSKLGFYFAPTTNTVSAVSV